MTGGGDWSGAAESGRCGHGRDEMNGGRVIRSLFERVVATARAHLLIVVQLYSHII